MSVRQTHCSSPSAESRPPVYEGPCGPCLPVLLGDHWWFRAGSDLMRMIERVKKHGRPPELESSITESGGRETIQLATK